MKIKLISLSIILSMSLTLSSCLFVSSPSPSLTPTETETPADPPKNAMKKKAKFHDLSFDYNDNFTINEDESDENTLILNSNDVFIQARYSQEDIYTDTKGFSESVMKSFESQEDTTIVEPLEETEINGENWYRTLIKINPETSDFYFRMYFLAKDYDYYSLAIYMPDSAYKANESVIDDIVATLTMDSSKSEADALKAKAALTGEWEGNIYGYMVFNEDNTAFWYKDSSKSMDNVLVGTYTCDNKIRTYSSGYLEGIYVLIDYNKMIFEGKEIAVEDSQKQEFMFTLNEGSENQYRVKNILTGDVNTMTKVK